MEKRWRRLYRIFETPPAGIILIRVYKRSYSFDGNYARVIVDSRFKTNDGLAALNNGVQLFRSSTANGRSARVSLKWRYLIFEQLMDTASLRNELNNSRLTHFRLARYPSRRSASFRLRTSISVEEKHRLCLPLLGFYVTC